MTANTKRLFIIMSVLVAFLGGSFLWLYTKGTQPYRVRMVGETTLHVPHKYMGEKPEELASMLQDYIDGLADEHRFQTPYWDLAQTTSNIPGGKTNIVWKVEPLPPEMKVTNSSLPPSNINLWKGAGDFTARQQERVKPGLYKFSANPDDALSFSYANSSPDDGTPEPAWISQCVRFRSLREGNSWGRCSQQLIIDNILLTVYLDGVLVENSGVISASIRELVSGWIQ